LEERLAIDRIVGRSAAVPEGPADNPAMMPVHAPQALARQSNSKPRTWDLFCQLVDNLGDVGMAWRLAADLATRGERVRLWLDDAAPLRFMAPQGCEGVEIRAWCAAGPQVAALPETPTAAWPEPGDVVIESLGCALPQSFVQAMLAKPRPPIWLNLEYLSAETYVERSHALPSPQANGLPKWFFFPGFTAATGGLLREAGLLARRSAFQRDEWLARLGPGFARQSQERVALLFCYDNPALAGTLQAMAQSHPQPTLLLLTPGPATQQVRALQAQGALPDGLRCAELPWLSQLDFDHALWCADVNFVRGEDSWVRALWAGSPFVWQLYPQDPPTLGLKLSAWLERLGVACAGQQGSTALRIELDALHRSYNGLAGPGGHSHASPPGGPMVWPDEGPWRQAVQALQTALCAQNDLVSQLQSFVAGRAAGES
jgi:uncharacterized repeat protein (TIGR03837 family)